MIERPFTADWPYPTGTWTKKEPQAKVAAQRSAVGPGVPLELRMSAEEYLDDGYSFDDAINFAKLAESKIDLLQVSTGAHEGSFDRTHPSAFMDRGVNVHYAEEIKKHVNITSDNLDKSAPK